jgi:hypothetical protein
MYLIVLIGDIIMVHNGSQYDELPPAQGQWFSWNWKKIIKSKI